MLFFYIVVFCLAYYINNKINPNLIQTRFDLIWIYFVVYSLLLQKILFLIFYCFIYCIIS